MRIGARVENSQNQHHIHALMEYTDTVAEIQNTLRVETPVSLDGIEIVVI